LKNFSWRNFRDVNLEVCVAIVAGPAVEPANDGDSVETAKVGDSSVVDCAEHVNLGASDVSFVFVVDSVLIEPVVDGGLEVDVVSEVAGTG